jgi:hypothetical protein
MGVYVSRDWCIQMWHKASCYMKREGLLMTQQQHPHW